jgi:4'-phosphopantetheinyl transferase
MDPTRQIHLWCTFFDEVTDDALLKEYRSLLTDAERAQEIRFHFARDRRRYLVTRTLVRTTLSRYVDIAPMDWVFGLNEYGRPEIANNEPQAQRISFNIAHTNSLIVLGVTQDYALGVDVENTSERAPIRIAEDKFARAEVLALRGLPSERQRQRFFEYWTLKEAYIKARGMGLSLPLDAFSFSFPDERAIRLKTRRSLKDDPARWRFWQFCLEPYYLVAVCAQQPLESLTLQLQRIVPLSFASELRWTRMRTSETSR